MKTVLTLVFLAGTLVFGGLWFLERQRTEELQVEVASIKANAKQQSDRLDANQRTIDGLKVQRADMSWEVGSLQLQVQALRSATNSAASPVQSPATASTGGSPAGASPDMGKLISQMMKNPQMKQMIQQQQKVVMDRMYQPLFKELNLSPPESDEFTSLLLERTTQGMEGASVMFEKDPQTRDEVLKKMTSDNQQFEDKVKALLGDDRYAKYNDYNQTVGERMTLNQFTSMNPIGEDQTRQLVDAMKEEKRRVMTELGESPTAGRGIRDFQAMASDEELNKLMQRQELVNSRVLERAKGILPPDQVEAFGKFQANQIEVQRMGMSMARTIFGGSQPNAAPSGPK